MILSREKFRKILDKKAKENKTFFTANDFDAIWHAIKIAEVNDCVIPDVISRLFKDPIDVCIIPEVYEQMINYRNENSKNQQRQLAVSCKTIKTILLNSVNGL